MTKKNWIDVSISLANGMATWPGDPTCRLSLFASIKKGAPCNVTEMMMSAHTGTHMDGPCHFLKGAEGLDTLPLDAVMGPARVIELNDAESAKPDELKKFRPRKGERLILKTRNSRSGWDRRPFDKNFVYISKEGAQYLVDCGIRTIGVDYLSVGGFYRDGVETHHILLGARVWIIEGLDLTRIRPGKYDLLCLPVKIKDSDGAPARALLRPRR